MDNITRMSKFMLRIMLYQLFETEIAKVKLYFFLMMTMKKFLKFKYFGVMKSITVEAKALLSIQFSHIQLKCK